jgi:hypothetical protein
VDFQLPEWNTLGEMIDWTPYLSKHRQEIVSISNIKMEDNVKTDDEFDGLCWYDANEFLLEEEMGVGFSAMIYSIVRSALYL